VVKAGGAKKSQAYTIFVFGGKTLEVSFAAKDAVKSVCKKVFNIEVGTDNESGYAVINGEYKYILDESFVHEILGVALRPGAAYDTDDFHVNAP
jgi:hypothetical protein